MGVYQAMQAAVTGLRGNSLALEHISGNIANSRTTGFKRTESYFVDLIPSDTATQQRSSGVQTFARGTMTVQGGLQNSYVETHMSINGDGYFLVEQPETMRDGFPSFLGTDNYTRRGDFDVDKNGYLVNGAGYYLKGMPVDRITNNVSGTLPDIIKLDTGALQPKATSAVNYYLNIPVAPTTAGTQNTFNGTLPANQQIDDGEVDAFIEQSITGGAITVYNPNGAPINMQFRWAKDTANPELYHLYQYRNDTSGVLWERMATAEFDDTGAVTTLTGVNGYGENSVAGTNFTFTVPANTIIDGVNFIGSDGGTTGLDISLGVDGVGLTNFSDSDGQVTINDLGQNGYSTGEFVEVTITSENRVRALYSNGVSIDQAEISLSRFNADNKLRRLDGGVFIETAESGPPIPLYGSSGAGVNGASLESSNVDIADEFTKLITTQQAYAANTRIVSTSDEMLQEVLSMKR